MMSCPIFVYYPKIPQPWLAIAQKIASILRAKGIKIVDYKSFDCSEPNIALITWVKLCDGKEELKVRLSFPELVVSYTIQQNKVTAGTWLPYGDTYSLKDKYSSVDEFIAALEQLPNLTNKNYIVYEEYICQSCGKIVPMDIDDIPEHCPYCGSNKIKSVIKKKQTDEKEEDKWYPDAPYWQPDY